MTDTVPCQVQDLRPGDLVTETDTPDGPWYEVVTVKLGALCVEAGTPVPVVIECDLSLLVLVRRCEQPL